MADNLYHHCAPLLTPNRLIAARDVLADRSLVPAVRGIYGWWFDEAPPSVPLEDTLVIGKHHLLYVGIAPRAPSKSGSESASTLNSRITKNHLGSRIGSSTLRRSLAWLMQDTLDLDIGRRGKKAVMSREDERRLTTWMAEHAAISFMADDCAWELEDELVASGKPALPLNLKGSSHTFAPTLRGLRARPIERIMV
jgi:hypothetical protein